MSNLQDYPPKVWSPHLGESILIRWYQYDEGHHVIVSDDEAGALASWEAVLAKHGCNVEIKNFFKATVVPCPRDVAEKWADSKHKSELEAFMRGILWLARDSKNDLPSGFEICRHREGSARHYNCKKCGGAGVRSTLDLKEMFGNLKVRDAWRKHLEPTPNKHAISRRSLPQPFDARITEEKFENLMIAMLEGGNHSPGVEYVEVKTWAERQHFNDRNVLFFFTIQEEMSPPEAFVSMKVAAEEAFAAQEAARKAKYLKEDNYFQVKAKKDLLSIMDAYNQGA